MSKAALDYLTRQLALELAPQVRVNAVAPAVVRTRFSQALYTGREELATAGYPLGRLGEPSDVAGAVAYLLTRDFRTLIAPFVGLLLFVNYRPSRLIEG
jgi:NAD(P)-dependent dehydrogenase (short-subunit alcohol dehydrogenase family)